MKKGDLYIGLSAIIILAILGLGYFLYINSLGSERYVNVYVGNTVVKTVKLTKTTNETFTVITKQGKFVSIEEGATNNTDFDYNIIHIYNNGVQVEEADCQGQDDVRQGFVSMPGFPIICIPHHLRVIIEGGQPSTIVDGIS